MVESKYFQDFGVLLGAGGVDKVYVAGYSSVLSIFNHCKFNLIFKSCQIILKTSWTKKRGSSWRSDEISHPVIGSARNRRSPAMWGAGGNNHRCNGMSAFQYEQEEDETGERVGIVTGGASGTSPRNAEPKINGLKALVWHLRRISHKRDGKSLL